jgi:hypothetical protein
MVYKTPSKEALHLQGQLITADSSCRLSDMASSSTTNGKQKIVSLAVSLTSQASSD